MTWRLFMVVAALLIALVSNGWMAIVERTPKAEEVAEVRKTDKRDPLRSRIAYTKNKRFENMKAFGFEEDKADAAFAWSERLAKARYDRLVKLVEEQADELSFPLCGKGELPPRYAMLEYLIDEKDGRRFVIDTENFIKLTPMEWFAVGVVDVGAVYDKLERVGDDRRPDATVMGIISILAHDEAAVVDEIPPFGRGGLGGSWSQTQAMRKYEGVDKNLIRYFGTMHLLAEIANKPGGICD